MCKRVSSRAFCVALVALILVGCGRQTAKKTTPDAAALATGPDQSTLSVPPGFASASIEAAGGLPAWMQCRELDRGAVVAVYQQDGSYYLTEHDIAVFPWSQAVRISAQEPRATFVWQIADGQYRVVEGAPGLDVSPLGSYRDYAEALLHIVTAPARMGEQGVTLTPRPAAAQLRGKWYQLIDAKYPPRTVVTKDKKEETVVVVEPYWTHGVYCQNQQTRLVDMIWLANPAQQRYLAVCGYDYAPAQEDGVLIPTKIEVFEAGPEETLGRRLVQVDMK